MPSIFSLLLVIMLTASAISEINMYSGVYYKLFWALFKYKFHQKIRYFPGPVSWDSKLDCRLWYRHSKSKSQLEFWLLCFLSSSMLIRKWPKSLGTCYHWGKPRILASKWPSPDHRSHWTSEKSDEGSLSPSATLPNIYFLKNSFWQKISMLIEKSTHLIKKKKQLLRSTNFCYHVSGEFLD